MKFNDGYWLMRDGVEAKFARQVVACSLSGSEVELDLATKEIRHRGDTLDGPLLTVKVTSPLPDIIRVRAIHFAGASGRRTDFELASEDSRLVANEGDTEVSISSGNLKLIVEKSSGAFIFRAHGEDLTKSGSRGLSYVKLDDGSCRMREQLDLSAGELVFGLGERFGPWIKNGQVVDIENKDGGAGTEQAYKNIPFYLTNRGYGVFVNTPRPVSFEVASEAASKVQFSYEGEELDYCVIYGPTAKDVIRKYAALTGRPALPPAWSFGLWLSTSFTTNYDEKTVMGFLEKMESRKLPLSVFHFDCFWMRPYHWTDFEWDPSVFPDPAGLLQRLKAKGLKISVWINSYIAQKSRLFQEAAEKGYLLKNLSGDIWQWDLWQAGMGIVDFTNPAAVSWFQSHLDALMDMGVDAFKTDFGERIPYDTSYHNGANSLDMHNYYPYLYNKTVFDAIQEKKGKGEAVVFARSASVGCQKLPVHWGGDCFSDFESMAESLRAGLSLGLSGFGFWSHDIGGFEGNPPADLYKRWLAFGLMSSHSRLHGSSSYRVPWLIDDESVEVLRKFTHLKYRLMPTLFAHAVEAHESGIPMMRAAILEMEDDPTAAYLDKQYFLGDKILVSPILSKTNQVNTYIPAGVWTHLLSGEREAGPKWVRRTEGFESISIFVKPHSILITGAREDRPDYDYCESPVFQVFEPMDGRVSTEKVVNQTGTAVGKATLTRSQETVSLDVEGGISNWTARFVNCKGAEIVAGDGTSEDRDLLVKPVQGQTRVAIRLSRP